MRNALNGLLLALVFTIVLAGTSCMRYKVASHTRDTIFVKQYDTTFIKADSVAIHKVDTVIETVFMEIEKDCPNVPKEKIKKWNNQVKEVCTHESLSGGSIVLTSPDLRAKVTISFDGNKGIADWEIDAKEIWDKEVKAPDIGFWTQVRHTWQFWLWQTLFAILWILFKVRKIFT